MKRAISRLLVTGGAGFIGSAFIRYILKQSNQVQKVVNLDALTYAADLSSLESVCLDPRYQFVHGDILDQELVSRICKEYQIDTIVHFAAQTHVDRSIDSAKIFVETNVMGTLQLLEVVKKNPSIHFHHVSTDEVYGSLQESGAFSETSAYLPNSPYAASKAASDHLVRSYGKTYGLSFTLSHCSNNYGPWQNKEKFIPRMINCLKNREPLPIYGNGRNVRDWLYVEDHVEAIWKILIDSDSQEVYDIGGGYEAQNLTIARAIIELYGELIGDAPNNLEQCLCFVEDRKGHDFRYSIDSSKIRKQLGWLPRHHFSEGLKNTMIWYITRN